MVWPKLGESMGLAHPTRGVRYGNRRRWPNCFTKRGILVREKHCNRLQPRGAGELSGVQAFDKWPPALALGMLSPRRQHLKKADFAIHIPLASRPARVIAAVEAAANAVRRRLRASGAQRAAVIPSVRFIGLGTDRLADRGSWVFRLRSWRPDRARMSPPCFRQSACGRSADSP
jgi:hypothetical protein